MANINTQEYWNIRFESGDWENKDGRKQTHNFAKSQVSHFKIPFNFTGTILDFGCGMGDALPIYHNAFPLAKLIGLDISDKAIEKCKNNYGNIAEFICGDFTSVPKVDIIIASNVFEHLSNNVEIAKSLLQKCKVLFIIVPYKEVFFSDNEHVNSYDASSFLCISNYKYKVFNSKGWSEYGRDLFRIYFNNIFQLLRCRKVRFRRKQIIFKFTNESCFKKSFF